MNDDTRDGPTSGRLSHLGMLRFLGPDAASFLQGQVSNDTRRLSEGAPLLAAFSSPQGRVIAVFRLIPHSSGVLALLPRELAVPTLERLRKYVMRAKVRIEDASGAFTVSGLHGASERYPDPGATGYIERDGIGIARVDGDPGRFWVLTPTDLEGPASDQPRAERDWRLADIRAGLPQVSAPTSEQFVAQMLNLDLVDGVSFTKGCFTGQEIIARTQHLGRIKRRMSRLRLPEGDWAIGAQLRLADGRNGRLTELAAVGSCWEALAVLALDAADGAPGDPGTDALSVAAVELPLPYPLSAGP